MNTSLQNLITNEDREVIHELHRITPIIKSKYFSLGRDIDKFMKLIEAFGKPPEIKIESVTCSAIVGNTLIKARQTLITKGVVEHYNG
jgi:hypothetical protein